MARIPSHREPTHPGLMLQSEFLEPLGMSQSKLADGIQVPFQRINEIVRGRRGITPSTALRLAKFLGTTPDFWLNLQLQCDLFYASMSEAEQLNNIQPHAMVNTPSQIDNPTNWSEERSWGQFKLTEYVCQVGFELVSAVGAAKEVTIPDSTVAARESEIRKRFEQLLPSGIRVGTGCVIDSFGNASQQIDFVLYHDNSRPLFEADDDYTSTLFPCEGVIAVGEIKSVIDSGHLRDVFDKVSSVKSLRRYVPASTTGVPEIEALPANPSLNPPASGGSQKTQLPDNLDDWDGRAFGFVLAGSSNLPIESIGKEFAHLFAATGSNLSPDILVAMDGSVVFPTSHFSDFNQEAEGGAEGAAGTIYAVNHPGKSFAYLISKLHEAFDTDQSFQAFNEFDRYIFEEGGECLPSGGNVTPLRLSS